MDRIVTFRLTIEQFRLLLQVVLAADAPDDLANLVLMACKRPIDGIIAVPVPTDDANALCTLVRRRAGDDRSRTELAELMSSQASDSGPGAA